MQFQSYVALGMFGLSFLAACEEQKQQSASRAPMASPTIDQSVGVYDSQDGFPPCDQTTENKFVYSTADKQMFICHAGIYEPTSTTTAEAPGSDPDLTIALNACGKSAAPTPPDLVPVSGQLAFSLPDGIDACSASGYVVGYQQELPLKLAVDGSTYMDNLPPGKLDIIITGSPTATQLINNGLQLGLRLNDVVSLPGVRRDVKDFDLLPLSSITGKARLGTLATGGDHAGILVYIPGTSFLAYTDKNGNYTITGVPQGTHNLFFEKDGYHRGQAEGLTVSENPLYVDPINLVLATGATGTFYISNAVKQSDNKMLINTWDIHLEIIPSPGALLMMVSTSSDFTGSYWEPIFTSRNLDIEPADAMPCETCSVYMPQQGKVYVKFADANGLESAPVSQTFYRDIFADDFSFYKATFNAALVKESGQTHFALTNINIPTKAAEMKVTTTRHWCDIEVPWEKCSENSWKPADNSTNFTLTEKYKDCGRHDLRLWLRDQSGHALYEPSNQETVLTTTNPCDQDIPSDGAPATPDGSYGSKNALKSTSADGKMIIFGYVDASTPTGGIYNPATQTWEAITLTGAPAYRKYFRLHSTAQDLFIIGGMDESSTRLNQIYRYDYSAKTWQDIYQLPNGPGGGGAEKSLQDAAIALTDTHLIVWGGNDSDWQMTNSGYRFNLSTKAWETSLMTTSGAPDARTGSYAIGYGTKVLITGGILTDNSRTKTTFIYNSAGDSWESTADLPISIYENMGYGDWLDFDGASVFLIANDLNGQTQILKYLIADSTWEDLQISASISYFYVQQNELIKVINNKLYKISDETIQVIDLTTKMYSDNLSFVGPYLMSNLGQRPPNVYHNYRPQTATYLPGHGFMLWGGKTASDVITSGGIVLDVK